MKRILSAACALVLSLSVAAPAFASEPSSITVSLSNMKSIVTRYSPQARALDNGRDAASDAVDEAKSSGDRDALDEARYQEDQQDLSYDQGIQKLVLNAKQLYLAYMADIGQTDVTEASLQNDQQKLSTYQQKLQYGYISQRAYDDFVRSLSTAENSVSTSQDSARKNLQELRTLLGVPESTRLNMEPFSLEDLEVDSLLDINYEDDLRAAERNNIDIELAENELDWQEDVGTHAEEDGAEISLRQAENAVSVQLKSLYDQVQAAGRACQTSEDDLAVSQADAALAQQKYEHGYLSKSGLDSAQLDVQSKQAAASGQKAALYSVYLDYIRLKNGY